MAEIVKAPLDTLAAITSYLGSTEIHNLWYCGNKALNSCLACGGVQKMVHDFGDQKFRHRSKFPCLLAHLRGLRHISAKYQSGFNMGAELSQAELWTLSPTLTIIDFGFSGAESIWIVDPTLVSLSPDLYIPSYEAKTPDQEEKTVYYLKVSTLFPNLQEMTLNGVSTLRSPFFGSLPASLTSLSVPWNHYIDDSVISTLPTNLTHLDIGRAKTLHNDSIRSLPRSLLYLDLRAASKLTSECFEDLPPHLTHLNLAKMQAIDEKHIALLPESLLTIDFRSALNLSDACLPLLPRNLICLCLNDNPILTNGQIISLPRSLRKLFLNRSRNLTLQCITDLPPDLETLVTYDNIVAQAYFKLKMPPAP